MCGIAGIVTNDKGLHSRIGGMLDAIAHRGPDDSGIYSTDQAVLGHRRLSIIDLDGGHQPIVDRESGLSIVFNGEIYNYKALRRELEQDGVQFRTSSDTEVILRLFQMKGRRLVHHLRGMFAFAIWNERTRELFAARDHLGQKPFYYFCDKGEFAFASEIKGLLAYRPDLRALNKVALDQYFSLRLIAPPHSMFRRVRKLPPAHCLTYSEDKGLEIEPYWRLDFSAKLTWSEDDILSGLEERLIDSVRAHMVSDVPVGAFMSGGLDSTLVASIIMRHVSEEPIPTFTLGLPHGQYNEAPLARLVAEKYGTRHHELVEVPSLIRHLPALIHHLDEPSDALSICTYMVSSLARKHVKVVVGGDGGDELFGGYDRYYGNQYAGYYSQMPRWLRRYLIQPALSALPDGRWYKSKAHQMKWLHRLSFEQGGKRYAKSLSYFYFEGMEKLSLYGPAMRDECTLDAAENVISSAFEAAIADHPVDRMLSADSQIRLPDHPVMITDRMTMAHGLEARSPFMDHLLAEFMAKVPVTYKVRGRNLRYLQKKLAQRYLPPELLEFPKQGFSSPLPYLLQQEYSTLFDRFLKTPVLGEAGLLDVGKVRTLLEQHKSGRVDHGNRLWLLLNAEMWYRMRIEGVSRETIDAQLARAA